MQDAPIIVSDAFPRRWRVWAHDYGDRFGEFGDRRFVRGHYFEEPVVQVDLVEDPSGPYWGWMATGEPLPDMIFSDERAFRMCFTYGLEPEVKAGRGIPIRLRVERTAD